MADQRFPRRFRLRKRPDFVRVQRSGRRFKTRNLVVCWTPIAVDVPQIGITVSRRVGGSVVRNQVKRWLRESIRRGPYRTQQWDVVFIARPSAARADFAAIMEQVSLAFLRLGRMEEPVNHADPKEPS